MIKQANPIGLSALLDDREEQLWRKIYRDDALRDQGMRCAYCREPLRIGESTADHVNPRVNGGPTKRKNIKACCEECNGAKGHWPVKKFRCAIRDPSSIDMAAMSLPKRMQVWRAHIRFRINTRLERFEKKLRKAVGL